MVALILNLGFGLLNLGLVASGVDPEHVVTFAICAGVNLFVAGMLFSVLVKEWLAR